MTIRLSLQVIKMKNWKRKMWFDETGLPWVLPSPNMPSLEAANIYPGMCLLEATNISEGRGTTKPFEYFGAPFIDPYELSKELNSKKLPGVIFRPTYFTPVADKFANKLCGGVAFHITDRDKFLPFFTGLHIIKTIHDSYPKEFQWQKATL